MTEKQALLIAYNILNDELEQCENAYFVDDDYKAEIQGAIETINKMYEARQRKSKGVRVI